MAYEKTKWKSGDLISHEKLNKIEDELEELQQRQDSIDTDTPKENSARLDKLENLVAANVSEKELTTENNFILTPTDAAIEMGMFDMKVSLPLRQEEKDGDISPNNPKQFLPYSSIDFLLYDGNANLLDKKATFSDDPLFTFDANNRVTGTIGAFSDKKIKLPRSLAGQKVYFYCTILGNTPTRLTFFRHMYNSSYSTAGSLAGTFYSGPTAYTSISDYYTLPTLDENLYDDIYMSILPAQGSSFNYSNTLTVTIFSAALQYSNGSSQPKTIYINLSDPILAGQADFSTGIATNQNTSIMAVYYLLNSADLTIESFVENPNGSNYVICTRPNGASENTRSSHYRYFNGSGLEFYFTSSDINAEYKFTIHDSRFTDEATAKRILGDRSNNINFAIVSSTLTPGISEKIITSKIKSNMIVMPSIPSAIAAKDGNLSSLKYYQNSNVIMEDLQNQINANKPHVMVGAQSSTGGFEGYVPAPASGDQAKYLRGDGQWSDISDILDKVTITADMPYQATPGALTNFADEAQVSQALTTVPLVAFRIAFKPSQSSARALPTAPQAITGHDIVQFDHKTSSTFVSLSYYYHLADAMLRPVYGGTVGGDQTGVVTYSESWIGVAGSDLTWEMVDTNGVITFEADLTEHGTAAAWSNTPSNTPLCDYYTCIAASDIRRADYEHPMTGKISYDQYFSLSDNKLIVREASCTTVEAFAKLIANATFVYLLSTTVYYNITPNYCYVGGSDLTPTPGASKVSPSINCYFSSPDGKVAVRYRKDLKAIINALDARITALESA